MMLLLHGVRKKFSFLFIFLVLLFNNGVFADDASIISDRTVRHSGTTSGGSASSTVDGNPSTCCLIAENDVSLRDASFAWFQIDLGVTFSVTSVTLSNSNENSQYLVNFAILVGNTNSTGEQSSSVCYTYSNESSAGNNANISITLACSSNPLNGRYVTIKRRGGERHDALSLCDIKVGVILADAKLNLQNLSTNQIGAFDGMVSNRAIDGNPDSCAQPLAPEGSNGWWSIDILNNYIITSVTVFNSISGSTGYLSYFDVKVGLNADVNAQTICYIYNDAVPAGGNATLSCSTPLIGRYVSVFRNGGPSPYDNKKTLYLCEIYIKGQLYNASTSGSSSTATSPVSSTSSLSSASSTPSSTPTISSTTPTSTTPTASTSKTSQSTTPTGTSTTTSGSSTSSALSSPTSSSSLSITISTTSISSSSFGSNESSSMQGITLGVDENERRRNVIIICVVVIIGGILILAAVGVVLFFIIRKKRHSKASSTMHKNLGLQPIKPVPPPKPKADNAMSTKEILRQPIAAELLVDYVSRKKSDSDGFKKEFEKLPRENKEQATIGVHAGNSRRNRFKNIVPYDHTLVPLDIEESDEPDANYINANYIMGHPKIETTYIASQGPKLETLVDFWRMIWQQNVNLIVMTTSICEAGKKKCEQYWPRAVNETKMFNKISVQLTVEDTYANHIYREMIVYDERKKRDQPRRVRHMQFLKWEDKTKPEHCLPLLSFRRRVQALQRNTSGPVVLHCSAGVGRTGTYIALDILLEQLTQEGKISFFSCVEKLRQQRMSMVQTWRQYHFLHEAVVDHYLTGETAIQCATFLRDYAELILPKPGGSKLHEQFEMLQKLRSQSNDRESAGTQHENLSKNRNQDIFAYDDARLYLETTRHKDNDYINAVYVDGYRSNEQCILTQLPLKETIIDLWRMIWDYQLKSVVVLNDIESDDKDCPKYWPEDYDTEIHGSIEIKSTLIAESLPSVIVREFTVTNTNEKRKGPLKVRHYQVNDWQDRSNVPSSPNPFISLINQLTGVSSKDGIVIQCTDGAKRSGLFAAAMYVIDMMKAEEVVDVFLACRFIAINRPQVINSQEQYKFLFELASSYMNDSQDYSNCPPRDTSNEEGVYANA